MIVRYHFRAWAREHVGSSRPAEVKRWFDARGLDYSSQFWANLLQSRPRPSIVLATWGSICDAAGVPLSTLIEIEPSQTPPAVQRRRARRERKPTAPPRPQPPRPADYFGAARG